MIIIKFRSNDSLETIDIHQYKVKKKIINRNQIKKKNDNNNNILSRFDSS